MRNYLILLMLLSALASAADGDQGATYVEPPYEPPKVMFDFYFDQPEKAATALYWLRSLMTPLTEAPYDMAPELMDIVVVVHGTEIVTLAKKNYARYEEIVQRMKYYAQLGVKFRVCALAAEDYGYTAQDFYDFVEMVPSAIIELAHWQQQGYAIITPQVMARTRSIEEIR